VGKANIKGIFPLLASTDRGRRDMAHKRKRRPIPRMLSLQRVLRRFFVFGPVAGFLGRQRAHHDGGLPLAVRHQLRGEPQHAQVRANEALLTRAH